MRFKAIASVALLVATNLPLAGAAEESVPKIAVAYDIGFLGDNGFNDAVHQAFLAAAKRNNLVEPFIREIPTSGTAVDRLSRLRFLAKSGYTLIITVGSGYRETVRRVSQEYPLVQFAPINDRTLDSLGISNIYFDEEEIAFIAGAISASQTKRKKIAIINGTMEQVAQFKRGATRIGKGIAVKEFNYQGNPNLLEANLKGIDVVYSMWDQDASLYTFIASQKRTIWYVGRSPDQFFIRLTPEYPRVLAVVQKELRKPIAWWISSMKAGSLGGVTPSRTMVLRSNLALGPVVN
ncbi:MAG: hypothetical protein RLZZ99_565 [Actinomycetota bacterium]